MINDRTANFDLPLPHPTNNPRDEDVPRLREALSTLDAALADLIDNRIASLPTSLPAEPGKLWNNGGMLSIS